MMMMMDYEFEHRNNLTINDIDFSLLRITSPHYDPSSVFTSAVSSEISPLKRSSPVSDDSDHPKRRKISPQDPFLTTSPPLFTSPETQSSSLTDPIPAAGEICCSYGSSVSEKQETTPSRKISPQDPFLTTSPPLFTSPETQSSIVDDPIPAAGETSHSQASSVSDIQETTPSPSKTPDTERTKMVNDSHTEEEEEGEGCGEEGMRIERSGDGFVIRLKCRCKQAFRVLFSDHHLYFKPL